MSKKNELATQQGGAIQAASEYARPYQMEGEDESDFVMPRLIVHQGKMSEKYYGKHPEGTLLNSVTNEVIEARNFHPIGLSWKEWIRLGANIGDPIVYRHRNKADVPKEDLEWNEDQTLQPKDRAPKASLFYNFIVIMEGASEPICLSLKGKSKAQRSAAKALNQMIKLRVARKCDPGYYAIDLFDASNTKGNWKDIKIRPNGNPPEDIVKLGYEYWAALSKTGVVVDIEQTTDDPIDNSAEGYDPNTDE